MLNVSSQNFSGLTDIQGNNHEKISNCSVAQKEKQVKLNVPFVPTHVLRERMLASSKCRKRFEGGKKLVDVWLWSEILFAGWGVHSKLGPMERRLRGSSTS
jgi:hypothetical protein